jgi:hypothetical protein
MSHGRRIPVSPPVHRPTGRPGLRDGWTAVLPAALVATWAVVALLATTLVWLIVAYESPSDLENSPARPAGVVAAAGLLVAAAVAVVFIRASLAR